MGRIVRLFLMILLLLYWNPAATPAQTTSEPAQVGCDTGVCHPDQFRHAAKTLEPGECHRCHKVEEHHGAGDVQTGEQGQRQPIDTSACSGCHPFSGTYWHPPAAARDCLACHVYHTEGQDTFLGGAKETLCTKCHLDLIEEGKMQHMGHKEKEGRISCCFCHSAHAAPFPGLLNAPLEKGTYVEYNDHTYVFCFSCHNRNLIQFADTMHYTSFRDGKKNLHFLHSNRNRRSINCTICHEIHQSSSPSLIVAQSPYGDWNMPINFNESESGGSCAPGCHSLKTYQRASYGTSTERRPTPGATETDRD